MAFIDLTPQEEFPAPQPAPPPPPNTILVDHAIPGGRTEYDERIERYFGSNPPNPPHPPRNFPIQVILDIITSIKKSPIPTNNAELHITFKPTSTNDDIELGWHIRDDAHLVDYSIPLFEEIVREYAPANIEFSKAIKEVDNPGGGQSPVAVFDVIFKLTKAGGGVYYGDLSNVWP